jgi:glycogen(starch) synthase
VDRGEHLGRGVVDGVEVRYLPTPLPARRPVAVARFLVGLPGATLAWWSAFRRFRPEVLHVQCFGPNGLYAAALSRLNRTPLVVSSHGETFTDDHAVFDDSALLRFGLRSALGRAARVTGCSQVVVDDLCTRFGARDGRVVPNGVDLDVAPPSGGRGVRALPTVLAVGRIERMKGFDLLLEAFAERDLASRARLAIGGDGGQLEALRARARELGVDASVDFLGRLDPDDVARRMAEAAVVVVPSRREAFGIVVLEAWRAGAPVVVTSRGGPATIVTHGVDGLVVDPEDIPALAAAVDTVLSDPRTAKALAEEGTRVVRRYSWGRVADAYEAIYEEVVV